MIASVFASCLCRETFRGVRNDRRLRGTYVFCVPLSGCGVGGSFLVTSCAFFRILRRKFIVKFEQFSKEMTKLTVTTSVVDSTAILFLTLQTIPLLLPHVVLSARVLNVHFGPPRRVPPKPPPSRRGNQPFTVLARSTSTKTLLPSIFLPSACL